MRCPQCGTEAAQGADFSTLHALRVARAQVIEPAQVQNAVHHHVRVVRAQGFPLLL